jgi:DNA primase
MSSREIDEIKARIDLPDLMREYIKLVPMGTSFKALCPFHHEKSPSLIVNRERQIWRCFGCNEGGDIFEFLMKMEGLSFPEALKILAQKAGVILPRYSQSQSGEESERDQLLRACDLATRYWQAVLWESAKASHAREYLLKRGVTEETARDFKIGFSVDSWDDLTNFLQKKNVLSRIAVAAGLLIAKDNRHYDRFRGRLMFPIANIHGQVIGCGARTLSADDPVKYINTPQTGVYNKSAVLYALDRAKDAIRRSDACILVEGYMDVIPAHQAGIKNVISVSGTALTIEQLRLIKRFTSHLILALDMDAAGQQAAIRSIEVALGEGFTISVVTLPHGKDPGECIIASPDDFQTAVTSARSVMDYFFDRALEKWDATVTNDRQKLSNFLLEKIALLTSPVERDFWIKKLAQVVGVSENAVREQFAERKKTVAKSETEDTAPTAKPEKMTRQQQLSEALLGGIIRQPSELPEILETVLPEYLEPPSLAGLYKSLVLFYNQNTDIFAPSAVDKPDFDFYEAFQSWLRDNNLLSDEAETALRQSFLLAERDFRALEPKEAAVEIKRLCQQLASEYITQRIAQLQQLLIASERQGDTQTVATISAELATLIKQRFSL